MRAKIDSVLSPVNYASGCAAETTCMAYIVVKSTFAGTPTLRSFYNALDLYPSQEHSCSALCSADGICQIDTTPQSIEATFTGRHETFQYTKVSVSLSNPSNRNFTTPSSLHKVRHPEFYVTLVMYLCITLAAKRLCCVKLIEPGDIEHEGRHVHTNEKQPFHFCQSR
jgi:hypothetical protein